MYTGLIIIFLLSRLVNVELNLVVICFDMSDLRDITRIAQYKLMSKCVLSANTFPFIISTVEMWLSYYLASAMFRGNRRSVESLICVCLRRIDRFVSFIRLEYSKSEINLLGYPPAYVRPFTRHFCLSHLYLPFACPLLPFFIPASNV